MVGVNVGSRVAVNEGVTAIVAVSTAGPPGRLHEERSSTKMETTATKFFVGIIMAPILDYQMRSGIRHTHLHKPGLG